MFIRPILAGIIYFSAATAAQARSIEIWSYQRLLETSDVVIIGTLADAQAWDKPLALPLFSDVLEGRLTRFKVNAVLKGELTGDKIELLHCRIKSGSILLNGPLLAEFREKGRTLKIVEVDGVVEKRTEHEGTPHYLLFLKSRSDGRFEPVAGQVDSILSVRLLSSAE